jgi:multiple sugar transport system substrate-binding protein
MGRAVARLLSKGYDFADFDPGRQKVATFEDKVYFAPLTGGGDLLVYRKDLLDKAGVKVPTTLDEMIVAVKKLHDPDHGVYGIALRGQRGSGANVWRWLPYFRGFGGKWFDGNTPTFDSEPAVKATQTYLDLFNYSPLAPRPAAGTSRRAPSSRARWRCLSSRRRCQARRSIRKCRRW